MKIQIAERDVSGGSVRYGDLKIFSSYLNLKKIPRLVSGEITHGWIVREFNIDPDLVLGSNGLGHKRKAERFFVARKDQEDYLRSQGFQDVHAIGHPITYIENLGKVKRIENSLLVMPSHSLPETLEDWHETDLLYADYLCDYIKGFDCVALCLHSADIEKNNWRNLKKLIPLIFEGALLNDRNTYLRMAQLFSSFEYVTSNDFGSHVAYASYFGAKVSVCGPRPKWERSYYESMTLYKNSPQLLNIEEDRYINNCFVEWYPQFNCFPRNAQLNIEWAKKELGTQCKRTRTELKELLGWTKCGYTKLIFGYTKLIFKRVMKKLYRLQGRFIIKGAQRY